MIIKPEVKFFCLKKYKQEEKNSNNYLDNFEFVEAPLQQHDKTLKQNIEFMMRGELWN